MGPGGFHAALGGCNLAGKWINGRGARNGSKTHRAELKSLENFTYQNETCFETDAGLVHLHLT